MIAAVKTPPFDWEALAPLLALGGGSVVALLLGLLPGRLGRLLAIVAGVVATIAAIVLAVLVWNDGTSVRPSPARS